MDVHQDPGHSQSLMVELTNVTKTFGQHRAVDDLSLKVPQGCIYGFIGPNGSGKTTTMRLIMNIFYPDSGTIQVLGQSREQAYTDFIGYLPEERGLYRKMKVKTLLNFYGSMKNGQNLNQEIEYWLERFDLTQWANHKIQTLSKGMSQKVQFIAAVVAKPKLLILDEPFSGLDPVNVQVMRKAILHLQSQGVTIIFSTHDMITAETLCDYIFMIFKGKKVLDGTLKSIQEQYGDDTIRVQTAGNKSLLKNLSGVQAMTNLGQMQELKVTTDSDTQLILKQIMFRTKVLKFELVKPSLYDIFLRIAGNPEREEAHE